ncbi:MAG: 30S ribosomal protein S8e [Candidatus Woesearchaeota archaeon]
MAIVNSRSIRKSTGGRYKSTNPKRLHQKASKHRRTEIGKTRRKVIRSKGGEIKRVLLSVSEVNLFDPKKKKHVKAKLEVVKGSFANQNFVRRNILTKGTKIKTDKGLAVVTNRPGQEGFVNAILEGE